MRFFSKRRNFLADKFFPSRFKGAKTSTDERLVPQEDDDDGTDTGTVVVVVTETLLAVLSLFRDATV